MCPVEKYFNIEKNIESMDDIVFNYKVAARYITNLKTTKSPRTNHIQLRIPKEVVNEISTYPTS